MSKFKAQTGNTLPLSSDESIEEKGRLSGQSVGTTTVENPIPSMMITQRRSEITLITGKNVSDNSLLAAQVMKAVLSRLEKDGLIRRFKVLSKDKTTVKEIRIVFSPEVWTEKLDLRLLSEGLK